MTKPLNVNIFQAITIQRLLEENNLEVQQLLDNKAHMEAMDKLNPNIRLNNEFKIQQNNEAIMQLAFILKS